MKSKIETVPLKNLKTSLFVRTAINLDHVQVLVGLMKNGTELNPIEISPAMEVIDGRHRIEAHELLNRTEIKARVVEVSGDLEMIAKAFKANMGGSLPPTQADIEHTVALLLERNVNMKVIATSLHLPPGMIRGLVTTVKSKIARAKLMKAVEAVADGGLTVAKAAEQFGVEPEKLKEAISGGKRKHKQESSETLRSLTHNYKSNSLKTAGVMKKLREQLEDGDVTLKQVREIFAHIDYLQKSGIHAIADWKKRFDALQKGKP